MTHVMDDSRPLPFYGPDDYDHGSGSYDEQAAAHNRRALIWDHAYSLLPWYKRLLLIWTGSVSTPFELVLTGPDEDWGVSQDGARLTGPDY